MSRTQRASLLIALIVIAGGLYWWWSSTQGAAAPVTTAASAQSNAPTVPAASTSAAPMSATVAFDGSSFSPASVTIAQGGTVTWVSTAGAMWVASDPYPIDNGYDGTTLEQHCAAGYDGPAPFDECAGSSAGWSFTFDTVGTWGYHDHLAGSIQGSVTVVAQQ